VSQFQNKTSSNFETSAPGLKFGFQSENACFFRSGGEGSVTNGPRSQSVLGIILVMAFWLHTGESPLGARQKIIS
jgi:hypothetical protein